MPNFRVQNIIKKRVSEEARKNNVEENIAFIRIFLREIFELDSQEIDDAITEGKNDGGIDSMFEYEEDGEKVLCLLQSKYFKNLEKGIDEETKNKLTNALENYILNECELTNIHDQLRKKIEIVKEKFRKGEIDKIELVIITNGQDAQPYIYNEMEAYLKAQDRVEFKVFSERALQEFLLPPSARNVASASLKIVKDPGVGNQTRLIFPQVAFGSIKGFVCKVDISEIAKFVEDNNGIFSANVRTFQSLKNKVNSEIEKTISDPELIEKFCYLNNGITIICEDVSVTPDGTNVRFKEPSIVNGCQTASTIYEINKKKKIEENVGHVLVRVIETTDAEFRKKIIIASNAQTAIKERDLRSEDDIQKQLEAEFLELGFFYERKSRMYINEDPEKVVPMDRAAQAYQSFFLGEPAEAKNKKSEIFKSAYDKIFDKDITAKKLLFCFKLLKDIEIFVESKKKILPTKEERSIYGNATLHILALYKLWILESENWNEGNLDISILKNNSERIEKVIEKMKGSLPEFENAQYFFKSSDSLEKIIEKSAANEKLESLPILKTEIVITQENYKRKKDWRYFKPDEFSIDNEAFLSVTHWSELFQKMAIRFLEKKGHINENSLDSLDLGLISSESEKNGVKLHDLSDGYFLNTNFQAKTLSRFCFELAKKNGERLEVKLRPTAARKNKNYKK